MGNLFVAEAHVRVKLFPDLSNGEALFAAASRRAPLCRASSRRARRCAVLSAHVTLVGGCSLTLQDGPLKMLDLNTRER